MDKMFFENRSRFGFEETINQFTKLVPENEWKVIQILDLQETMRKNGKDVLSVKVLEICKPDYAYRLLSEDSLRIYSNMLPCRVSVYEKTDGETYISRMNSEMFASQIGGVMQEVMSKAFDEVEAIVKEIAKD